MQYIMVIYTERPVAQQYLLLKWQLMHTSPIKQQLTKFKYGASKTLFKQQSKNYHFSKFQTEKKLAEICRTVDQFELTVVIKEVFCIFHSLTNAIRWQSLLILSYQFNLETNSVHENAMSKIQFIALSNKVTGLPNKVFREVSLP